jgi:hypothetical protein
MMSAERAQSRRCQILPARMSCRTSTQRAGRCATRQKVEAGSTYRAKKSYLSFATERVWDYLIHGAPHLVSSHVPMLMTASRGVVSGATKGVPNNVQRKGSLTELQEEWAAYCLEHHVHLVQVDGIVAVRPARGARLPDVKIPVVERRLADLGQAPAPRPYAELVSMAIQATVERDGRAPDVLHRPSRLPATEPARRATQTSTVASEASPHLTSPARAEASTVEAVSMLSSSREGSRGRFESRSPGASESTVRAHGSRRSRAGRSDSESSSTSRFDELSSRVDALADQLQALTTALSQGYILMQR